MLNKKLISSKIVIIGLFIFFLFMLDLKYQQWKNQKEVEKQKQNLVAQTDTFKKKNDELNQSLQYLNSTSFKERVAREQLNLKKEGETVYSFDIEKVEDADITSPEQKDTNMIKWWNYFFSVE